MEAKFKAYALPKYAMTEWLRIYTDNTSFSMASNDHLCLNSLPSFDLNQAPSLELEGDYDHPFDNHNSNKREAIEEAPLNYSENLDSQPDQHATTNIPVVVRSSSNGVLMVDLNVASNEEDCEIIEINMGELEDNEEHSTIYPKYDGIPQSENQHKRRFLSNGERRAIYDALLERIVNGKLKRNTTNEVSSLFSVPLKTVQRIWKRAKDTPHRSIVDVSHRKIKNCGRKRVIIDSSAIASIPLNQRTTLRSLAAALNINHVTLYAHFKEGLFRRHSNAIRPHLNEEHKMAQLRFCLSMLDTSTLPHKPKFVSMYNFVHIDEKWFYMTKNSKSFYSVRDDHEKEPLRTCHNKSFISKVMFLAAIVRPRFDEDNNELFSGKIGVFPFVTTQPALRRSRYREAGTLETKPLQSVNKEIVRAFMIEKIIPAIRAKWPREELGKIIFIQQDNTRTHIQPIDEEFQRVALQSGFDIRLICQPANSPDLNVLDLGFFNAIQSLQQKKRARTNDELIGVVQMAYEEYPTEKINHVFMSLQLCMREIMKVEGSNQYKTPLINKAGLERNGVLPTQISCDIALVENFKGLIDRTSRNLCL